MNFDTPKDEIYRYHYEKIAIPRSAVDYDDGLMEKIITEGNTFIADLLGVYQARKHISVAKYRITGRDKVPMPTGPLKIRAEVEVFEE